jgi:hypothetical protein
MTHQTDDLRIKGIQEVSAPEVVREEIPLTDAAAETVYSARQGIHQILHREDDRLLVVVGPCSIHDVDAALDYAGRLGRLREELGDALQIVMRVYFEKPRTTVGWKGLINDPDLDDSFHINKGLRVARGLLRDLAVRGMPAATEYLDLISPQYIADLVHRPLRPLAARRRGGALHPRRPPRAGDGADPAGAARRPRRRRGAHPRLRRAPEAQGLELPRAGRHAARAEGHAARSRRPVRAGRQGGLSVVGADERDPGQGRRRAASWSWWCRRRTAS